MRFFLVPSVALLSASWVLVVQASYIISVDKSQYYQDTSIVISYESCNDLPFTDGDSINVVSDSVSGADNCVSDSAPVRSYSVLADETSGVLTKIITWNGIGSYKAVLCRDQDNPVLAESDVFSIEVNPVHIMIQDPKPFVYQGEYLNVSITSDDNNTDFGFYARFDIIPSATIDNYTYDDIVKSHYMYYPSENQSFLIDWGFAGSYNILFFGTYYESVLAVSDTFNIQPNNVSISFGKDNATTYYQGEKMDLFFSSTYGVPLHGYFTGGIVPAYVTGNYSTFLVQSFDFYTYNNNNNDNEFLMISSMNDSPSVLTSTVTIDWLDVGSFKVVFIMYGDRTSTVLGISAPFEVALNSAILTLDKTTPNPTYYQGETFTMLIQSEYNVPFNYDDTISIFPASVTTDYGYESSVQQILLEVGDLETNVNRSITVAWSDVGMYKAVLFVGGGSAVLGISRDVGGDSPVLGISRDFEIIKNTVVMTLNTSTPDTPVYSYGDSISITITSLSGVPFNYNDYVQITLASSTEYYSYVKSFTLDAGSMDDDLPTVITRSFQVDWDGIDLFKAVFYIANSRTSLASSPLFAITSTSISMTLDKNTTANTPKYVQGQTMVITIQSTNGISLSYYDYVRIIPSSVMGNFSSAPFQKQVYLYSYGTLVNKYISIDWPEPGSYKAVLFSYVSAKGVSPDFETVVNNAVITLNKNTTSGNAQFLLGEEISMTIQSTLDIPFNYYDYGRIISSSITSNYSKASYVKEFYLLDNASVVNQSVVVDWVGVGSYKVVLFAYGTSIALGISADFEVSKNNAFISLDKNATTPDTVVQYKQGETIIITFQSPSNDLLLNYWDYVRIIPASVTSDYFDAPFVDDFYLYNRAKVVKRSIVVAWSDAGTYKAVLFFSDSTILYGVSPVFEVVANANGVITLNKNTTSGTVQYYQGEKITLTIQSGMDTLLNYYDYVRIVSSAISSNYYNAPYTKEMFLYAGSNVTDLSFVVDWKDIGTYKAVLFIANTEFVAGISPNFMTVATTAVMTFIKKTTSDNVQFLQGETLSMTLQSSTDIPFRFYDYVRIVPSSITSNYATANYKKQIYLIPITGTTVMNQSFTIDWSGLGSYKAILFIAYSEIAIGVSPDFNITANNATIGLNKNATTSPLVQYRQGEALSMTIQGTKDVPFNYYDFVRIVSSVITSNYINAPYKKEFYLYAGSRDGDLPNAVSRSVRVDWTELGSYKAVLFISGSSIAYGISPVFEMIVNNANITLTNSTTTGTVLYSQGEAFSVTIQSDRDVPLNYYDYVKIVSSSITSDYYSVPSVKYFYLSVGTNDGDLPTVVSRSIRVDWPDLGSYKLVMFLAYTRTVVAISPDFEIIRNSANITLTKNATSNSGQYIQGETLFMSISCTSDAQLSYYDFVRIIPSSITSNYINAPSVKGFNLYTGSNDGDLPTAVNRSVRIDWTDLGSYKAVLFLAASNIAFGISDDFEVEVNNANILFNKTTVSGSIQYPQGDTLFMRIQSTKNVPLNNNDYIRIISSVFTTNYYNAPFTKQLALYAGSIADDSPAEVNRSIRVDWTDLGFYKAVLFIGDSSIAYGVSPEFEVIANNASITLNKNTAYRQGETLSVTIQSDRDVPLNYYDYVKIVSSSITSDYYYAPSVKYFYLSVDTNDGDLPTVVNRSIRVDWPDLGSYKLVMFLADTSTVVAISPDFDIVVNNVTLSLTKNDTSGTVKFIQGETLSMTIQSSIEVPLNYYDYIRVISSAISSDYSNAPSVKDFYLYSGTNNEDLPTIVKRSFRVDWSDLSSFKIVLFLQSSSLVLGISPVFEVGLNNAVIELDKNSSSVSNSTIVYYQGESITFSIKSSFSVSFNYYDYVKIYDAAVPENDYKDAAYVGQSYLNSENETTRLNFVIDWIDPGQYKAVLFAMSTGIVLGTSSIFDIQPNSVSISYNKQVFYQGETIEFVFSSVYSVPFNYMDRAIIVKSNETDYSNAPYVKELYMDGSQTLISKFAVADWEEIGLYKVVLFVRSSNVVIGVSQPFSVKRNIGTIKLNKNSYFQGEVISMSFTYTQSATSFNYYDYVYIFPVNTTNYQVAKPTKIFYLFDSSTTVSKSVVVDWRNEGYYQIVLFLQNTNVILIVSQAFEIKAPTVRVSNDKVSYFQGESIQISLENLAGVPFNYFDYLMIVPESTHANNFSNANTRKMIFVYDSSVNVNIPLPVNWDLGSYKAVLLVESSEVVLGVSNSFTVQANNATIEISQPSYNLEEPIELSFNSTYGVPFNYYDIVQFIPAANIDNANPVTTFYLSSTSTFVNNSFTIDWTKPGAYRALLLIVGSNIVFGVSSIFEVKACPLGFFGTKCLPLPYLLVATPNEAVDSGGTSIFIQGYNLGNTSDSVLCSFGGVTTVPAQVVSSTTIKCISPTVDVSTNGFLYSSLQVVINSTIYSVNSVQFTFYGNCLNNQCINGYCTLGRCKCFYGYRNVSCDEAVVAPRIAQIKDSFNISEGVSLEVDLKLIEGTQPVEWALPGTPLERMTINANSGLFTYKNATASSTTQVVRVQAFNEFGSNYIDLNVNILPLYYVKISMVQVPKALNRPAGKIGFRYETRLISTDQPVGNKEAVLWYRKETDSIPRKQVVVTNSIGFAQANVLPFSTDAGKFVFGGEHPQYNNRSIQGSFSILGVDVIFSNPVFGFPTEHVVLPNALTFRVVGGTATNIVVAFESVRGITIEGMLNETTVSVLNPDINMNVSLQSSSSVIGEIDFTLSSNEGLKFTGSVYLNIRERSPKLHASPEILDLQVVIGGDPFYTNLVVENIGSRSTGPINIINTQPRIVQSVTYDVLPSLDVDQTAIVTLKFSGSLDIPVGSVYFDVIAFESDFTYLEVPYKVTFVSQKLASLTIVTQDEASFFADDKKNLANVSIRVKSSTFGTEYSRSSGTNGTITIENILEDVYVISAQKQGHVPFRTEILLQAPGQSVSAFLQNNPVSYTFKVVEVPILDTYVVDVQSTFQTFVPWPVVVWDPAFLDWEDVFLGRIDEISLRATNYGLIAVHNLTFSLPQYGRNVHFQLPDEEVDPSRIRNIGTLAANSSVVFPIQIKELVELEVPPGRAEVRRGNNILFVPDNETTSSEFDVIVAPNSDPINNQYLVTLYQNGEMKSIYSFLTKELVEFAPSDNISDVTTSQTGTYGTFPNHRGLFGKSTMPARPKRRNLFDTTGQCVGSIACALCKLAWSHYGGRICRFIPKPCRKPKNTGVEEVCDAFVEICESINPCNYVCKEDVDINACATFQCGGASISLCHSWSVPPIECDLKPGTVPVETCKRCGGGGGFGGGFGGFGGGGGGGGGSCSLSVSISDESLDPTELPKQMVPAHRALLSGCPKCDKDKLQELFRQFDQKESAMLESESSLKLCADTALSSGGMRSFFPCALVTSFNSKIFGTLVLAKELVACQLAQEKCFTADDLSESPGIVNLLIQAKRLRTFLDAALIPYTGWDVTLTEATTLTFPNSSGVVEFANSLGSVLSDDSDSGGIITFTELQQLLSTGLVNQINNGTGTLFEYGIERFVETWNYSTRQWLSGNYTQNDLPANETSSFFDIGLTAVLLQEFNAARARVQDESFTGFADAWLSAVEAQQIEEAKQLAGVCASVRVSIKQEFTLTRVGFEAQLVVLNDGSSPLVNVAVTIRATVFGNSTQDATSLFVIGDPELNGLTSVSGDGIIAANSQGEANWLIIPLSEAAPVFPTKYDIGGFLIYTIEGVEYIQILSSDTISVRPDPQLYLSYFQSRVAHSDDPFTRNRVEAAIPFQLALLIENKGYGDAKNFQIASAQPKIIDNVKGLLVDFKIIGSHINDNPASNALTLDFGSIPARSNSLAVWDIITSLRGTFRNFSATFQYRGPINDDRLSLIESVTIYELTHLVRLPGAHPAMLNSLGYSDDSLDDFLVNMLPDAFYLPDTIFRSDSGNFSISSVIDKARLESSVITDNIVTCMVHYNLSNQEQTILKDWVYIRFDNPMTGTNYILQNVTRIDVNYTLIPLKNSWQTMWIDYLTDGSEDIQDYINLFDFGVAPSYRLVFTLQQPVTNVRVINTTESTVSVGWNPAPGATAYYVVFKPTGLGTKYHKSAEPFIQINSAKISSLALGTSYDVTVYAGTEGVYEQTGATIAVTTEGVSKCGNGVVDQGEECDAGVDNGTNSTSCTVKCWEFVNGTDVSSPTQFPVTSSPTENPQTRVPTKNPVTSSPTGKPQTKVPTITPVVSSPTEKPQIGVPTNIPATSSPSGRPLTVRPTIRPIVKPTKTPIKKKRCIGRRQTCKKSSDCCKPLQCNFLKRCV